VRTLLDMLDIWILLAVGYLAAGVLLFFSARKRRNRYAGTYKSPVEQLKELRDARSLRVSNETLEAVKQLEESSPEVIRRLIRAVQKLEDEVDSDQGDTIEVDTRTDERLALVATFAHESR
jgi:hypothetical protein